MTDSEYRTCGECGREARDPRRGLCKSCYHRMLRTPEYREARLLNLPRIERFKAQIQVDPSGCWLWTGRIAPNGYGYFSQSPAHRFAYEQFVGPIPPGMQIDHVAAKGCRHRHCVNWVDHLEVVTPQANVLRAPSAMAARWAARTHCNYGHELNEANTMWRKRRDNPEKTYRACRTCAYALRKRQRARSKVEIGPSADSASGVTR